jgi:hypothetical protein
MFSPKERKGRKTSTTTTPECSHSCNWNCAFCVSHEMNECSSLLMEYQMLTLFLTSSVVQVHYFLKLSFPSCVCQYLLTEEEVHNGVESFLSFACSRATTHVELQTSVLWIHRASKPGYLLTYFTTDERSHEPSSSSWLWQWTQP